MQEHMAEGIRWLREGLALLLPRHLSLARNEQLHIELADEQLRIHTPGATTAELYLPLTTDTPEQDAVQAQSLRPVAAGRVLTLLLPADMVLRRNLQLPLAAASELHRILGFEVERCTPFQQTEVYLDCRELSREPELNRLHAEFTLVPRSRVDALLGRLQGMGLAPHVLDVHSATGEPCGLNLLPRSQRPAVPGQRWGAIRMLAGVAAVLLLANLYLPLLHQATTLRALERELAVQLQAATQLQSLRTLHTALLARSRFPLEQRKQQPTIIALLAEFTQLLPDDSWLERFSLHEGELQLQGQSSAPAALIQHIENSAYFQGTQFRSPITRNESTHQDHFHISTRLTPGQRRQAEPAVSR